MAKLRTRIDDSEAALPGPGTVNGVASRKRVRRPRRVVKEAQPNPISKAADLLLAPVRAEPEAGAEKVVKPVRPRVRPPRPKPALKAPAEAARQPEPATAVGSPPAELGFRDLLGQAVGLRLDSAGRVYRSGSVEVTALAGASLQIAPGEFVAIMGPSGCGKSTLLNLVGGLDRPTSGRVFAAGVPLDQLGPEAMAEYRLLRVGSVFQSFNLIPELSVSDNIALPLALAGVPVAERAARVGKLLDLVRLRDRARFRPSRLSGGEQQRTAVARALANRPGLILADEPTGSLDTEAGESVLQLLEDAHRRGATVLLVTHDPAVAMRADRVITMRDGRLLSGHEGRRVEHAPAPLEPAARLDRVEGTLLAAGSLALDLPRTAATVARLAGVVAALAVLMALSAGLHDRVLGGLAVFAAAVAMVTSLGSWARTRRAELGILRALGARAGALRLLYATQGALLGLLGAAAGLVAAEAIAWAGSHIPPGLGSRLGPSSTIHLLHLSVSQRLILVGLAVAFSALGGLLPALAAGRRDPAGLLRSQ